MSNANKQDIGDIILRVKINHNTHKKAFEGLNFTRVCYLFIISKLSYDKRTIEGIHKTTLDPKNYIFNTVNSLTDNGYLEREIKGRNKFYSLTVLGERVIRKYNT